MAGDTGRLVAQRQECRDWAFTAEPAAEEFGGNKSLAKGSAKAFTPKTLEVPVSIAQMSRSMARMLVFPHSSRKP